MLTTLDGPFESCNTRKIRKVQTPSPRIVDEYGTESIFKMLSFAHGTIFVIDSQREKDDKEPSFPNRRPAGRS